ncbi:putative nucleotidyltransferase [Rhodococcus sp. 27YEA15]|uniref:hypothetical protein n=1 Tax=Rhodococcus sp. 27YEA15 TaxID=3156259 RepID=UPI003C7CC4C4
MLTGIPHRSGTQNYADLYDWYELPMGLTLVIIGSGLQFFALAFTLSQIMGVIGIRRTLIQTVVDGYQRIRGVRSAEVHGAVARWNGHGTADAKVIVAGETEVDRLNRVVEGLESRISDMDARIVDLGIRTRGELDDCLSQLQIDRREQAEKDATLAWWGVVFVGLGIVFQVVGSVLQ